MKMQILPYNRDCQTSPIGYFLSNWVKKKQVARVLQGERPISGSVACYVKPCRVVCRIEETMREGAVA
jgi:hypothetical protein